MLRQALLLNILLPRVSAFVVTSTSSATPRRLLNTRSMMNNALLGDFAGHSATFSSVDGSLIPVPEYLVPEAMIDWGQVPTAFEVVVSEDLIDNVLERNIVSIMPEIGCGVDNLDTIKKVQTVSIEKYEHFTFGDDVSVATAFATMGQPRIECIFAVTEGESLTRTRVSINLTDDKQLKSPIDIARERRTSTESSRGTIADKGGLDARSVMQLIGKGIKPFTDKSQLNLTKLEGEWKSKDLKEERGKEFWDGNGVKSLSLSGNVIVRCLESAIEISLMLPCNDGMKRIVVSRTMRGDEDDVVDGFVENFQST